MVKYCSECGTKVSNKHAKFCFECGEPTSPSDSRDSHSGFNKTSIFLLGEKMEEAVEHIFKAKGYETERRLRIKGKSNTINEIDILAKKRRMKIAIECKNYSTPIGQSQLRDFVQKLEEIQVNNGFFVSNSDFTSGATTFAKQRNITLWSKRNVMEEFWNANIGRGSIGKEIQLKNALPINLGYVSATNLELANSHLVKIESASLFFKPYYVVEYRYKARYTDPTRVVHNFYDEDTVEIDGIDGSIVYNTGVNSALGKILQPSEEINDDKILDEILNYESIEDYRIVAEPFSVNIMEPNIQKRVVKKTALDYITEINTEDIHYTPKSAESIWDEKTVTYSPKRKDILIKNIHFLYIPKWNIQFQSLDHSYTREVYGFSGNVIEDTIEYCPHHFKLGGLRIVSKNTYAICEQCGEALCEEHVSQCPICNRWICGECGVKCSNCSRMHCSEHITKECNVTNAPLCNSCLSICPICQNDYGKKNEVTCEKCGRTVCKTCSKTKGWIRRKKLCAECFSEEN